MIAKAFGLIPSLHGRPEITYDIILRLSEIVNISYEVFVDSRGDQTYTDKYISIKTA